MNSLPPGNTVLCLRSVKKDGTSYKGFKYPVKGYVEAPDWSPTPDCFGGLYGYLKGEGSGHSLCWDGLFQVVKVLTDEVVDLGFKVKFPRCEVILTGSQQEATSLLTQTYPNSAVIGATVKIGDNVSPPAYVGNYGTAIAGENGSAIAGYRGKAMTGNGGTLNLTYYDAPSKIIQPIIAVAGIHVQPNVLYRLDSMGNFVELN